MNAALQRRRWQAGQTVTQRTFRRFETLVLNKGNEYAARAHDLTDQGIPWTHHGRKPDEGLDWLGFLRAVYQPQVPDLAGYAPDWNQRNHHEVFLWHLRDWGLKTRIGQAHPGDVVLFRMDPNAIIAHGAVFLGNDMIAHAYWGHAPVRSRFATWWRLRSCEVLYAP